MTQSVLGSLTLGYQPLWNRARSLAALRLFVHEDAQGVDGQHLLRTLAELSSAESAPMVLAVRSRGLLADVLAHADAQGPLVEVPLAWLDSGAMQQALAGARQRGVRLLAAGSPQDVVPPELARMFERRSVQLSAVDAASALKASLELRKAAAEGRVGQRSDTSPVRTGALVDGVASRQLAEHALDQQGAWAIAGWPVEDVLHPYAPQPMPISRRVLVQVMNALDNEESLERIDQLIGQEPVLAYRLLLHFNSVGIGLRSGVSTVRHGLMMLGFRKIAAWLAAQLPGASEDANLRPVNAAMVLRGHLMEHLMDAGVEDDLRREIYLCGLFSQLDLAMHEPLKNAFSRIPLSEWIVSATISHTGPYAASLQLADALESSDPRPLRQLRDALEVGAEEVNRALLRTLAVQAA